MTSLHKVPSRGASRANAEREAKEAVAITQNGGYSTPSGAHIDLSKEIARAVRETREYPPHLEISAKAPRSEKSRVRTNVRVENRTSLASARDMVSRGLSPLVLNFASAKNPGGGFLRGAIAQEESLARSSALYACIEGREMYTHHREHKNALYTHWMIHSPRVPVFRDDESGALLETPYTCAFLTAAAPNAGEILEREPHRADEVNRAMKERVHRALTICRENGHFALVLGAWGCGVFKNDPTYVAACFDEALRGPFAGAFTDIAFAVLDGSEERRFIAPFESKLGSKSGPALG